MKLRYTRKASEELAEILDYLALNSPAGEQSVARRLKDMIALLEQYPQVGQLTSKAGLRRLVVLPYPYLVFYRVTRDTVIIHGVRHGARKPLRQSH